MHVIRELISGNIGLENFLLCFHLFTSLDPVMGVHLFRQACSVTHNLQGVFVFDLVCHYCHLMECICLNDFPVDPPVIGCVVASIKRQKARSGYLCAMCSHLLVLVGAEGNGRFVP